MINNVILVGRLTNQPDFRVTQSGTQVSTFTVAVNRPGKDKHADFIDCVCFMRLAEVVSQFGDKGRLVAVAGRLQTRSYETQDGHKRKATEVIAESVQFLDNRKPETGEEETFNE